MKITMRRNEAYRFYSLFHEGEIICFEVTPLSGFLKGFTFMSRKYRVSFLMDALTRYKILATFV